MKTILFILMFVPSVLFGQKFEVDQVITYTYGNCNANYGIPGCAKTQIDFRDSSIVLTFHDSTTKVLNVPKNYRDFHKKKFYVYEDDFKVEYIYSISDTKTSYLRITNKQGRIAFLIFAKHEI